ncbi:MAG TPA: NAD-dependent epimerase/dehydratase family protein [Streptosporangiaceae bacterium]|jgi:nucleoside-diphosphate-sugar epimerase|nr:NAD-dependent epimerase/dehydratase family protein [Streptosporangiaceae bacterium]
MHVVVVGATGNVGTSTVQALAADPKVTSILGLARRLPGWTADKTEWASADITESDLTALFRGADAVVHLAWLFQPTRQPLVTWQANVFGSARVFRAVAEAGVPALVYASSVGAYSPGPADRAVDETWPTHSWPTAAYGREKAYVERLLDSFQVDHPDIRIVRLRPGFIFKREAAAEQRRLFAGPLVPGWLARPGLIPLVPDVPGLRVQVVHAEDAAQAYRLAVLGDARGPFNIAADPVIDGPALARLLGARTVRVPASVARAAIAAGWYSGLVPADPKLFDLALRLPLMDTRRAREQLGWAPVHSATETVKEFLAGLRGNQGMDTPPLAAATSGRFRLRELRTGTSARP